MKEMISLGIVVLLLCLLSSCAIYQEQCPGVGKIECTNKNI